MKKKSPGYLAQEFKFYTLGDKIMVLFSALFLLLFFIVLVYPLLYAFVSSFNRGTLPLNLIPEKITLAGYIACFNYSLIWSGFLNSLLYTSVGTSIALLVTICCAYSLSVNLRLRGIMLAICMFTMYFDGGLIPTFLWIKQLGLYNTMWAVILPASLSIFNMLVMRTYFATSIPGELREAAELDGANDIIYLFRIVIPLSGAVIAVVALYYASAMWNSYFYAMIYIQNLNKLPLPNVLRNILTISQSAGMDSFDSSSAEQMEARQEVMKYCVIIVATVPMMIVYPFIQKNFVKGVMIGAVKG